MQLSEFSLSRDETWKVWPRSETVGSMTLRGRDVVTNIIKDYMSSLQRTLELADNIILRLTEAEAIYQSMKDDATDIEVSNKLNEKFIK